MNLSNLSHPVVQARIYAAMRMAVNAANGLLPSVPKRNFIVVGVSKFGVGFCMIKNKSNKGYLTVLYDLATEARPSGFTFEAGGKDVTDVVIQSLRSN